MPQNPKSKSTQGTRSPKKKKTFNPAHDDSKGAAESTAIPSLLKAVIYIMSVLVVAGFLSYFAITWANDAFALVKTGEEVVVTVGENMSISALGKLLDKNGIINHPSIFKLYCSLKGESPTIDPGEYTVSPTMSYDELLDVFAKVVTTTRTTVVVTIPEGFTVDQIINRIVNEHGISSHADFEYSIKNDHFDYWFIEELDKAIADGKCQGRKYRLEGYLYPDTYYFYSDSSAKTVLNKMLRNFDNKMKDTFKKFIVEGDTYIDKIHTLCDSFGDGYTFDEVVRIASMVEKESIFEQEYSQVSQVFHNRLLRPTKETNGKMESDATIYYVLDDPPAELTEVELSIDSPYNTRLYKGLPPGAICNPSVFAIHDTLLPDTSKSYKDNYYFLTDSEGYMHFAKTYAQHLSNVKKYMNK